MKDNSQLLDGFVGDAVNQFIKKPSCVVKMLKLYHSLRRDMEHYKSSTKEKGETYTRGYYEGFTAAMSLAIQHYCSDHHRAYGVTKADIEAAFARIERQQDLPL